MEFLLQLISELFDGEFMRDEASSQTETFQNEIPKAGVICDMEEDTQYGEISGEEEILFNFMHFR